MYSCVIADILEKFAGVATLIMGDVTYGACCVDDLSASALGADFLVHYGHSCLVPVDFTTLKVLYVFVEIAIDVAHMVECVRMTFPDPETKIAIMGTIQFSSAIAEARSRLAEGGYGGTAGRENPELVQKKIIENGSGSSASIESDNASIAVVTSPSEAGSVLSDGNSDVTSSLPSAFREGCDATPRWYPGYTSLIIPQTKPLSPGETLGCTSPVISDTDVLVFVADGRFHLESAMIRNPNIAAYRYDPYPKILTRERYDHAEMQSVRCAAISTASGALRWGIILGTLGRQGNPSLVRRMQALIERRQGASHFIILLSEIFPAKLAMLSEHVDAWVQVACPRLSVDWGYAFDKPLLSTYEAEVALGSTDWKDRYPMDYYARDGGSWSNYHSKSR
jgi:2-(3-amino-3-carboxypropyl)histidine synthase